MNSYVYLLYDRIKETFTGPYSLAGTSIIDETQIVEALTPMYEIIRGDDAMETFVRWVVVPMVVVFGEDILTNKGKELINTNFLRNKIDFFKQLYTAEKENYLKNNGISELKSELDYTKFANSDIAAVGKAFIHALKFKKVKA